MVFRHIQFGSLASVAIRRENRANKNCYKFHRFEKLSRYYNSICGRSGKANFFHLMMSYYDVVKKSYNFTKFLSNINFPHAIRIWTVILKTYAWMQAETIEVYDIQVICQRCTQVLGIRTQNWLCIAFLYFKMLARTAWGQIIFYLQRSQTECTQFLHL